MQKQFTRFMIDVDKFNKEEGKVIFDISAGKQMSNENADQTYVFTSLKLDYQQYGELLEVLVLFEKDQDMIGKTGTIEIFEDDVLSIVTEDINVQLFFENKKEISDFHDFLLTNPIMFAGKN